MNDVVSPVEEPRISTLDRDDDHAAAAAPATEPVPGVAATAAAAEGVGLADLEARADELSDPDEKIFLWVQMGAEIDRDLGLGKPVEPALLARMVRRTAEEWPGGVGKWLERARRGFEDQRACLDALLAALQSERVDLQAAEELAAAAVELAPDRESMIRALEASGDVLERRVGAPERAAAQFRAAAEHCSPDESAEAIRLLERARTLRPDDASIETRLIEIYAKVSDFAALRLAVRRLSELRPDPVERTTLLLSLEGGAVAASATEAYCSLVDELLPELLSTDVARARSLTAAKARVLIAGKRLDTAVALYEELIEAHGDDDDVRTYVGLLELGPTPEWRRDKRRWLFEWRAASAEDPASVMMHWARVEEREFDDVGAAIRTLERAFEKSPDRADALFALARLRLLAGEVSAGMELLSRGRGLADPERSQAAELELAGELRARPDCASVALELVGSVLEHSPLDAVARDIALEFVPLERSWARACDLVEQSVRNVAPTERAIVFGRLLEATEPLLKRSEVPAELAERRRGWLGLVLETDVGGETARLLERAASGLGIDEASWQAFDERALERGDPAAAVRAYERALRSTEDPTTVEWLARRLIRVVEAHLSDPRAMTTGLLRVLELNPQARWAFDRVKLSLSLERRWDDLFPLYESAIAAEKDEAQRAALLDEAAVAARDVASDPERAIRYWEEYLALSPRDGRVDLALERLYERQRRVDRLIEHLRRREGSLAPAERVRLRERVAGLELERNDGRAALEMLQDPANPGPPSDAALELLERVLMLEPLEAATPEIVQTQREVARDAARLLEREYLARSRVRDAARVFVRELSLASDQPERVRLLRELIELYDREGDARASFDALGQLLLLEPGVAAHRARLADLAVELGAMSELAALEVRAAAEVTDEELVAHLLGDAARIEAGLGNAEAALGLWRRILGEVSDKGRKLEAATALEQKLAELERPSERCGVLERIAELAPFPEARRKALLESARIALDEIGAPARAALSYRTLIEETSAEIGLLDGWVRALSQTDQYAELVRALRARAEATPERNVSREDLGFAARLLADRLGDSDAAIESWRAIRARFGPDAESFEALSALLEGAGRWHELAALISEEAEGGRGHSLLFTRLAEVHVAHTLDLGAALAAYVRAGDLERAAQLLCDTPSLVSDNPKFVLEFVGELVQKGQTAAAERVLGRQLEHYGSRRPKESAAVHLALSDVLCAAGRKDAALSQLVAAAERHPSNAAILVALGRLASERGDLARAEQSYQALLVLIPHYPEAAEVTSRAELYLALSELSRRRGEPEKAEDQLEWAFEAALASDSEARALERGLAQGFQYPLLERAIRGRLERATTLEQRLGALSDLVSAGARAGALTEGLVEQARSLGRRIEDELLEQSEPDPVLLAQLTAVYDTLAEPVLVLEFLEKRLERAGDPERFELELDRARRMLRLPARSAEAIERLWELVRDDAAYAEAAEVLSAAAPGQERVDELVSVLDDHATLAAAEGRANDAKALRLRIARVLENAGRTEDALHAYLALASDESYKSEARRRALALLDQLNAPAEDVADAVDALLAIADGREASELASRLIVLAEELDDADYLERGLDRGFFADPGRADLRERLLDILDQRGEWIKVRDVLERAIERSPEPELVLRLADAHLQTGAPDRALDLLETVGLRVAPERAVRRRRAATLEAAGRTEEALEELLLLNQTYGDASEEIGSAIRRTRIWTDSERWALLAIETSIASGSEEEANTIVEHWVERGAHSAALLWQLGELSSRAGDHARAARVYRRLNDVEEGDQRNTALVAMARALEDSGDAAGAARALETALLRAPEASELFRALYDLYARLGEFEKQGRLLLEQAGRAEPDARPALLHEAAEVFCREGAEAEALEALSRLETLEPEQIETSALRARVLRKLGRNDEALEQIQRFLSAESRPRAKPLARLYRELGEIHLAKDQLIEAYQALSSAHQIDRADTDTAWLFGMIAYELDQTEVAAAALRAFLTLRESGGDRSVEAKVATAYSRLGCIELDRGQVAAARRLSSQALQLDPAHPEATRLFALLGAT